MRRTDNSVTSVDEHPQKCQDDEKTGFVWARNAENKIATLIFVKTHGPFLYELPIQCLNH